MILEVLRRSMLGLGFSALFTFAILTVIVLQDVQVSIPIVWKNMLGSMMMGIYFGCASLIFEMEKWSPLKKTVLHFLISILVWLPLAVYMGWVPFEVTTIFIGLGIFLVIYLLFWYGFYFYFKMIEKDMNNSVKK